jgi:hypothetical protein
MTSSLIVFLDMLYIGEIKALVELHEMYVNSKMRGIFLMGFMFSTCIVPMYV